MLQCSIPTGLTILSYMSTNVHQMNTVTMYCINVIFGVHASHCHDNMLTVNQAASYGLAVNS